MSSRESLLVERGRLLARSEQLRRQWSQDVQVLRAPLGVVDRVREGVQWLARNPQWPLAAVVVLVVLRPGRVLRWSGWALQGYTVYQRVQRVLNAAPRRRP